LFPTVLVDTSTSSARFNGPRHLDLFDLSMEDSDMFVVKPSISVNGCIVPAEPQTVHEMENGGMSMYCLNLTSRTSPHLKFFEKVLGMKMNKGKFRRKNWRILKDIRSALEVYRKEETVRTPRNYHTVVKLHVRQCEIWILNTQQHITFCFENDAAGFDSLAWLLEAFYKELHDSEGIEVSSEQATAATVGKKRTSPSNENKLVEEDLVEEFLDKFTSHYLKPQLNYFPSRNSFRMVVEAKKTKSEFLIRIPGLNKARLAEDTREPRESLRKSLGSS
jgi:hypothetical protein